MLLTRSPLYSPPERGFLVRLACVKRAASVDSEPGSNSRVKYCLLSSPKSAGDNSWSSVMTQNSKLDVRKLHVQPDFQRSGPRKIVSPLPKGSGNTFRDRPQTCFDDKRPCEHFCPGNDSSIKMSRVGFRSQSAVQPTPFGGHCPPASLRSVASGQNRCKRKVRLRHIFFIKGLASHHHSVGDILRKARF